MDNKVANVLLGLGITQIVLGILLGFVFGYDYYVEWGIMFTWIGIGTVSGIFTIGFSQVIELLHHINLKLGNGVNETEIIVGISDDNESTELIEEDESTFEPFTDENGVRYEFQDKDEK